MPKGPHQNTGKNMSRNLLLLPVATLAIVAAVLGYLYYQEQQNGMEIEINENGVSIDGR
jgi:hypothetical protein